MFVVTTELAILFPIVTTLATLRMGAVYNEPFRALNNIFLGLTLGYFFATQEYYWMGLALILGFAEAYGLLVRRD